MFCKLYNSDPFLFSETFSIRSTICQKPFTEISLQIVSVPGPDFEYTPLSRPSMFHRDLNTPAGKLIIGSLSNDVFERRTSTGSCPFSFLGDGFAQIFSQIVSIRVKKLSNTNYIASRHITREKSSLPVNVRCSKTSLLKLPNYSRQLLLSLRSRSTLQPDLYQFF